MKNSHCIKVSDNPPASKGKGHRIEKLGPERSNAMYPGYPKVEAPWPQAKPKKP